MSTRRTFLTAAAATLLTGGLAACGGDEQNAAPAPAGGGNSGSGAGGGNSGGPTIRMVDFAFEPSTLEVSPGATITVINTGDAMHDLDSKQAGIMSEDLAGGEMTTVQAPEEPGDYDFMCTFHPIQMTGTLTVSS